MSFEDPSAKKNPPELDGAHDMTRLLYLEDEHVLDNIRTRFQKQEMYTSMSTILIAVNPYQWLPVYGADQIKLYYNNSKARVPDTELPLHIYGVAGAAYRDMFESGQSQSVLVCGESGAGKTESAKKVMHYLTQTTQSKTGEHRLEDQLMAGNPIMESFGNAKTVLNNNSSRFGKFTKMMFAGSSFESGHIAGVQIETYLLEKSRVTLQAIGERNFHIFYQICRVYSGDSRFQMADPSKFYYLDQTGRNAAYNDVDGISDTEWHNEVKEALTSFNVGEQTQQDLFAVVAGLLHLGNIKFEAIDDDSCKVDESTAKHVAAAADLLGIDEDRLRARLTSATVKVDGGITTLLSAEKARHNRDAIAQELYTGLFGYIVSCLNKEMVLQRSTGKELFIGILDIAGFEKFEHNSFEQFCINFANEKLQQFFNEDVIKNEQEEYLNEGVYWVPLDIPNNDAYISLVQHKTRGLFSLLDAACRTPKATSETFVNNLFQTHKRHSHMRRAGSRPGSKKDFLGFAIKHYAGKVVYDCDEFLDKNRGSIHPDTIALALSSSQSVLPAVFPNAEKQQQSMRSFQSIGRTFSNQVNALMLALRSTRPQFVRCVKPNENKSSSEYDRKLVHHQLKCGGIFEALRVMKHGYPTRIPYKDIYAQFSPTMGGHELTHDLSEKDFCEAIVIAFGAVRKDYQMGRTKIFFRPGKGQVIQEMKLWGKQPLSSEHLERIRMWLIMRRISRLRGRVNAFIRFDNVLREVRWREHQKKLAKNQKERERLEALERERLERQRLEKLRLEQERKNREQIQQLTRENEDARAELDKMRQQFDEDRQALEAALAENESEKAQRRVELERKQQELVELENKIAQLEAAIEREREFAQQELNRSLARAADDKNRAERQLQSQIDELNKKIERVSGELQSSRSETDQVQGLLNEQERQAANLKMQLNNLEQENKGNLEDADRRLERMQKEKADLEERMEALKQQHQEHVKSLQDEFGNASAQSHDERVRAEQALNKKMDKLRAQIAELEGLLADANEDHEKTRRSLDEQKREAQRLLSKMDTVRQAHQAELGEAERDLQRVEKEKKALENKMKEMRKKNNEELMEAQSAAERMAQELRKNASDDTLALSKQIEALKTRISELESELSDKSEELEGASNELANAKREQNSLNLKLQSAEAEAQAQMLQLKADAERLEAEKASLAKRIAEIKAGYNESLKKAQQEYEDNFRIFSEDKKAADAAFTQRIEELSKRLAGSEQAAAEARAETEDNRRELAEARRVTESKERQLEKAAAEKKAMEERLAGARERLEQELEQQQEQYEANLATISDEKKRAGELQEKRISDLMEELSGEQRKNATYKIKVDNMVAKFNQMLKETERESARMEVQLKVAQDRLAAQRDEHERSMSMLKQGYEQDMAAFQDEKQRGDEQAQQRLNAALDDLAAKEDVLAKLEGKVKDAELKHAEKERELARLNHLLEARTSSDAAYEDTIAELQAELDAKDAQLAERDNKIRDLLDALNRQKQECDNLQMRIEQLEKNGSVHAQRVEKQLERAQKAQEALQKRLDEQRDAFMQQQQKQAASFDEVLAAAVADKTAEAESLQTEVSELREAAEKAAELQRDAEGKASDATLSLRTLERERNTLKLKLEKAEKGESKALAAAQRDLARVTTQRDKLDERLGAQKTQFDAALAAAEEEFKTNMSLFEDSKKESEQEYADSIAELNEQIVALTKELAEAQDQLAQSNLAVSEAQRTANLGKMTTASSAKNMERSVEKLSADLAAKEEQLTQLEEENFELSQQLSEEQQKRLAIEGSTSSMRMALKKHERQVRMLEQRNKQLSERLARASPVVMG